MKGMELPLNMIVVIAVAVLVLTVVAIFFTTQTGSGFNQVEFEGAFAQACNNWRSIYECSTQSAVHAKITGGGFKFPGDASLASMDKLCGKKLGDLITAASNECRIACGCPQI